VSVGSDSTLSGAPATSRTRAAVSPRDTMREPKRALCAMAAALSNRPSSKITYFIAKLRLDAELENRSSWQFAAGCRGCAATGTFNPR
jgi:hypothetical protein